VARLVCEHAHAVEQLLFLIQLDPATGAPLPGATAEKVPESDDSFNAAQIVLGCNATCHVVYTPATSRNPLGSLVSWAPGQAAPITVAKAGSGGGVYLPEAAATPGGRLWIAYADTLRVGAYETVAKLGGTKGCEKAVKSQLTEVDSLELTVQSVQLAKGETAATAQVKSIHQGKSHQSTLSLVKEGAKWKISGT